MFPELIRKNDENNIRIDELKLGVHKRKCWEFQQEWRYLMYLGLNIDERDDEKKVRLKLSKKKKIPNCLFAKIEQKQFERMTVLLGPGTNEADAILVEALGEKYNPSMKMENSYFRDKILTK